jgi:glutamine synthetase
MQPAEVLEFAKKNGAKMVDFKFVDLLGIWQHTTMPIAKLEVGTFRTATSSTAAPSAVGSRSTPPT